MSTELFKKYDVQAPRYTSYPTVPYWEATPNWQQWQNAIRNDLEKDSASWSMYLHIPYCETLCSFCGCNTVITRSHDREMPYVELLLKEWSIYKESIELLQQKELKQIHLGGGTPTFLSASSLAKLLEPILASTKVNLSQLDASIEVDPRRTNKEQLQVLFDLGFRRISLGVQDFNPEVQKLINRMQSFEENQRVNDLAREIGFNSVNFDLIYGLPQQTPERMQKTLDLTLKLRPDRIAFYSLAIVPWIKPAQRLFKIEDLPSGEEKYRLYEMGREKFLEAGYIDVGMDHFALPSESLAVSKANGQLHRNFMGYTHSRTDLLLGIGVSSISETSTCFHQNKKELPVYEREIEAGQIPTLRGHLLTSEDRLVREQVLAFMTGLSVEVEESVAEDVKARVSPMIADGLVEFIDNRMCLTEKGQPFLRNAAMALDRRLLSKAPGTKLFSKAL